MGDLRPVTEGASADPEPLHRWDVTPQEAFRIQRDLRRRLVLESRVGEIRLVAGADMAFAEEEKRAFAVVLVLDFATMQVVEKVGVCEPLTFPYIPGLLSFREGPPLLKAFGRLKCRPDVVIFDGQGIAHPRGLGLASHVGLWLGMPSIGCAKSKLVGDYQEPGPRRGMQSDLTVGGEVVGRVLRTRDHVQPVFVSPGHLMDIPKTMEIVLRCCRGFRLPEPTRLADIEVEKLKSGEGTAKAGDQMRLF